jgi:hypothetical protein
VAHKSGIKGNSRNFGLHGAPGKGSKDRTSDRKRFNENFDAIKWGPKKNERTSPAS